MTVRSSIRARDLYGRSHGADVYSSWDRLPDIVTMGDQIFDPCWTSPHSSDSCELLFVIEGQLRTVLYRRRGLETKPGGIVLIPEHTRHRDEFDLDRELKVFLVFFRWQHSQEFFKLAPPAAIHRMSPGVRRQVGALCGRLRLLIESGTEADRLLARGYLLTILLLLLHGHLGAGHRLSGHSAATGRHRRALMLRARQYLDDHYAEEISLERLAETLKISPFYLSHLFSQEADFTFMEYLTHRRMGEARRLLEAGGHNVSETACAVGYRDANYFAKVFRRHFGLAPHEIRGPARPVQ